MIILVTFLIRTLQAAVDAAPTILAGCFCAAFLHVVVGRSRVRAAFSKKGLSGILSATVYGSLLPVCSLGVIPILLELRAAKVSLARMLAFAVSAPLLNPITVCYGLTILTWPMFLTIVVSALLLATATGLVVEWLTRSAGEGSDAVTAIKAVTATEGEDHVHVYGLIRMLNLLIVTCRTLAGSSLGWIVLGMVASGATAAMIPADSLGHMMGHNNPWAPLVMLGAVTTQFVSPATGIMQVAAMEKVHWSLAAALMLQLMGVGVSLASLVLLGKWLGLRRMLAVSLSVVVVSLAIGYAANAAIPLIPTDDDETHAIDNLSQPFGSYASFPSPWQIWVAATTYTSDANGWSLVLVLTGIGIGTLLRWRGIPVIEGVCPPVVDAIDMAASQVPGSFWNQPLSPRWLGGFAGAGLLAGLVVVIHVYYPPVEDIFGDISGLRAEALSAINQGQLDVAATRLDAWDRQLDKLEPSTILRGRSVPPHARESRERLSIRLREVEAAIGKKSPEEVKGLAKDLFSLNGDCRRAFLESDKLASSP